MMPLAIPLTALPAQTVNVVLDGQYCTLSTYQRQNRLYLDLASDSGTVCRGALCQNRTDILQSPSTAFKGSLHFYDTEGERAPKASGLGSRFVLLFVPESETMPAALSS